MPVPIVIETRSAGMTFGPQQVLRGINLRCAAGEFVSLLGPSGCGKSTLLRLIANLEQPTEGSVRVVHDPGPQAGETLAETGFVFQDPTLLPWRNVWRNIALPLELHGSPAERQQQLIADSLRLVGLSGDDALKYPHMLSGGMRMRVSLARALVTRPRVLLLDEPFAALDDLLRSQLNEELLALWAGQQWTVMFVTHNVAEAVFLSQRIVVLGGQPSGCVAEIEIPLPYPRTWELRGTPEFAQITAQVSAALREPAG